MGKLTKKVQFSILTQYVSHYQRVPPVLVKHWSSARAGDVPQGRSCSQSGRGAGPVVTDGSGSPGYDIAS